MPEKYLEPQPCACGCGEIMRPLWDYERKSYSRFIRGHHIRVAPINHCNLSETEESTIVELYRDSKVSQTEIAQQFNISRSVVHRILCQRGVEVIDSSTARMQNKVNLSYFDDIDSEDKAYWLGFLAADGNITCSDGRYRIALVIKADDKKHLELFRQSLNSSSTIRSKMVMGNEYVLIQISGKQLAKRLVELGITPRKSLTLEFPVMLPDELNRHFMRGYFDGDGCIARSRACKQLQFMVLGTKSFLEVYCDKLLQAGCISSVCLYLAKASSGCYQIAYTGNRQVPRIMNWLYQDATIFLSRKRQRYLELIHGGIQLDLL